MVKTMVCAAPLLPPCRLLIVTDTSVPTGNKQVELSKV
jgi:hypothetical protein